MRDLDLLNKWLVRQRQAALQYGHMLALGEKVDVVSVKSIALQAEFCDRVRDAVRALANDPGKFIKDYLGGEGEERE